MSAYLCVSSLAALDLVYISMVSVISCEQKIFWRSAWMRTLIISRILSDLTCNRNAFRWLFLNSVANKCEHFPPIILFEQIYFRFFHVISTYFPCLFASLWRCLCDCDWEIQKFGGNKTRRWTTWTRNVETKIRGHISSSFQKKQNAPFQNKSYRMVTSKCL